jgi:hypothetical protein
MVTSRHQHGVDGGYTTPATRAKWVRLHFLGAPLPNGFPGAQPVKPEARRILRSTPKPRWSALSAAIVPEKSVAGEKGVTPPHSNLRPACQIGIKCHRRF